MPFQPGQSGNPAGKPVGTKNGATLEREAVSEAVKQRILNAADNILTAQMVLARGQSYLYRIDKTEVIGPKGGISYKQERPVIVEDPGEILEYLAGDYDDNTERGASYYYISTKEPSNQAIDSMFNRALGKATDVVDITTKGDKLGETSLTAEVLAAAEKLLKEKKTNEQPNERPREEEPNAE